MARRIQQRRMAGEGSMYRWRGYWAMDVELPRLDNGKRRRKKLYAKTTTELLEKRRAFELESGGLLHADLETLTLAQLLDAWLEHGVKIKNRAHTYESSYEPIVRLHLKPALGRYKVKKLTTAQGQALINEKHKIGLKPRTLRNIRAVLRKALNQARVWYGLQSNIADAIEVPPAEKPHYRTLDAVESQAFLNALIGHRLEALYWTAILMGLRLTELIGLQENDIDLVSGLMRVRQQIQRLKGKRDETTPTKSGKEQVLTLPSILVPMLRAHLDRLNEERRYDKWQEQSLLFPNERGAPLHPSYIWKQFKKALVRAGIEPKGIRFHDLRHTCASLMISKGVHLSVVKERMRHSQISVTADTYGHVFEETQRAAGELLGGLFVAPEAVPLELPRKT